MAQVYNISFTTGYKKETPLTEPCGWTDVKVKQAWLNSAAALSAITGAGAAVAGLTIFAINGALLLAAVPFFVASGLIVNHARSLIDYEDPKVLTELRKNALDLSLPKIVEKHTWEKLFRFEILSPTQFTTFYRTHVDALSFNEMLTFFHVAKKGLDAAITQAPVSAAGKEPFVIPSPTEWKSKFETETKGLRCDQIVDRYSLADLKTFQIVPDAQLKVLDDVVAANHVFSTRREELQRQFKDRTPYQHSALENAKRLAELQFASHYSHSMLSHIDRRERDEISSHRSLYRSRICAEKQAFNNFEHSLTWHTYGCNVHKHQAIEVRRQEMEHAIAQLKEERNACLLGINMRASSDRLPLIAARSTAEEIKNLTIRKAEEDFRRETAPIRSEIDALHAKNSEEHEAKIVSLEKIFRAPVQESIGWNGEV